MKGSEFALSYVHSLYYKCHKIKWNCGGSCTDSPDGKNKTKKLQIPTIKKITNAFNTV